MTQPNDPIETTETVEVTDTYKLPYEICEKFMQASNRTAQLTPLDVRLGLEQIIDDPQFIRTAQLRGWRVEVPEYAEVMARWIAASKTGSAAAEYDPEFGDIPVPESISRIINLAEEDSEEQGTLF